MVIFDLLSFVVLVLAEAIFIDSNNQYRLVQTLAVKRCVSYSDSDNY